ncbi:MAG: protein kinase [Myxococcales bacterium]|nr:protein kinase [Myxococcales bacterium]
MGQTASRQDRVATAPVEEPHPGAFTGAYRFDLLRKLGDGGMGEVYLARDLRSDALVAVKMLRSLKPRSLFLFKQEFRSLADAAHPNLVRLHELFHERSQWFFSMEYVRGVPFDQHVLGDQILQSPRPHFADLVADEAGLRDLMYQITEGVCFLHRRGIVHRDLKPDNVLVTAEGRAVILDFGLVRRTQSVFVTGDSVVEGTPGYMAPDEFFGHRPTASGDWYSVGVILYESLTGELPYPSEDVHVLARQQCHPPDPPSHRVDGVPADLERLCMALLEPEPRERADGDAILAALGKPRIQVPTSPIPPPPSHAPPLGIVGRDSEQRLLLGVLAAAEETRRPQVVLLSGAGGVGKTTLLEAFARRATDLGSVVLSGRCYERESLPFKALDGVIDQLCSFLRSQPARLRPTLLPDRAGAVAKLFPVLAQIEQFASAVQRGELPADPVELRRQAFAGLKQLLRRVGEVYRLVLCIDDLQWGDMDSALLLDDLIGGEQAPAVVLVLAYRPEEAQCSRQLELILGRFEGCAYLHTLELDTLSADAGTAIAAELLGPGRRDEAWAIAAEAGGNPYLIGELAGYLAARPRAAGAEAAQVSLTDVTDDRLAALDADARGLLRLLAVARRPILWEVVERCAERPFHPGRSLDQLRDHGLIRVLGEADEATVAVSHTRIGDAVRARLSDVELRSYNRKLLDLMELSASGDLEALVQFARGAGEPGRAFAYAVRGARQAEKALAFDQAIRLYWVAVELRGDELAGRRWLLGSLAEALIQGGRRAEAAEVLLSASEDAPPFEGADLRRRAGEQSIFGGYFDAGTKLLSEALVSLDLTRPLDRQAAQARRAELRQQLLQRGLTYVRWGGNHIPPLLLNRLDTAYALGFGLLNVQRVPAQVWVLELLGEALGAGDAPRLLRALCLFHFAVDRQLAQAEGGDVLGALTVARELGEGLFDPQSEAWLAMAEGHDAFLCGELERAERRLLEALAIFRDQCTGSAPEVAQLLATLHLCLWLRGDYRGLAHNRARLSRLGAVGFDRFAWAPPPLPGVEGAWPNDEGRTAPADNPRDLEMQFLENGSAEGIATALGGDLSACMAFARRAESFLRGDAGRVPIYASVVLTVVLPVVLLAYHRAPQPELLARIEALVARLEGIELPSSVGHAVLYRACLDAALGRLHQARTAFLRAAELLSSHVDGLCAERQASVLGPRIRRGQRDEIDEALRAHGIVDPAAFAAARVPLPPQDGKPDGLATCGEA